MGNNITDRENALVGEINVRVIWIIQILIRVLSDSILDLLIKLNDKNKLNKFNGW